MRQADALAGPVLGAGAAEQLEHALLIALVDAASVVAHFVDDPRSSGAARDRDAARRAGPQILQSVVEEVGEHLLQGEAIADERRQVADSKRVAPAASA